VQCAVDQVPDFRSREQRRSAKCCRSINLLARFKPVGRFDGREIVEHRMLSFDPTTPLGSWKRAGSKLTAKAGLAGLRFHDLRHHSITELAESGCSEQTIKAIPGHVSQRMLDRYPHLRLEAKRNALEALSNNSGNRGNRPPEISIPTNVLLTETRLPNGCRGCSVLPVLPVFRIYLSLPRTAMS
jgi:hypothetical protein